MTDAGQELRVASDTLLNDLEVLTALEAEKRTLSPDDPRMLELAAQVQSLAKRVLEGTARQHRLAVELHEDPSSTDPIEETPRSAAAILEAWRDAERRLQAAAPGSADAETAEELVDRYREEYRRAYEALRRQN
ncbi:MAG: hypothetical protein HYX57_08980 [Chloroflexi bacterium]|nr:hypothetical protein [Chloroflexota bacterium]